ncbi:MAG: plasmid replication initiator RepA, partial [Paracoccaceae bacterium]
GNLPDYVLTEEPGDIILVIPAAAVIEASAAPLLKPETFDEARTLAPGADVYALEAEWRAFWAMSGRPRLRSADAAFLGWMKGKAG